MPDRSTREVVESLQLHRHQLVADVKELEDIVRHYLALPARLRDSLATIRLSGRAYLAIAGAALLVGLGAFLARRR